MENLHVPYPSTPYLPGSKPAAQTIPVDLLGKLQQVDNLFYIADVYVLGGFILNTLDSFPW